MLDQSSVFFASKVLCQVHLLTESALAQNYDPVCFSWGILFWHRLRAMHFRGRKWKLFAFTGQDQNYDLQFHLKKNVLGLSFNLCRLKRVFWRDNSLHCCMWVYGRLQRLRKRAILISLPHRREAWKNCRHSAGLRPRLDSNQNLFSVLKSSRGMDWNETIEAARLNRKTVLQSQSKIRWP